MVGPSGAEVGEDAELLSQGVVGDEQFGGR